jgi:hypothetical protein
LQQPLFLAISDLFLGNSLSALALPPFNPPNLPKARRSSFYLILFGTGFIFTSGSIHYLILLSCLSLLEVLLSLPCIKDIKALLIRLSMKFQTDTLPKFITLPLGQGEHPVSLP